MVLSFGILESTEPYPMVLWIHKIIIWSSFDHTPWFYDLKSQNPGMVCLGRELKAHPWDYSVGNSPRPWGPALQSRVCPWPCRTLGKSQLRLTFLAERSQHPKGRFPRYSGSNIQHNWIFGIYSWRRVLTFLCPSLRFPFTPKNSVVFNFVCTKILLFIWQEDFNLG